MAHSSTRNRRTRVTTPVQRDTRSIARRSLLKRVYLPVSQLEDRRVFHPERAARVPRTLEGRPVHVRVKNPPRPEGIGGGFGERFAAAAAVPFGLSFADASRVVVCTRRKARREVLHANGVAGRRGLKPPRFNFWSKISCKG